ncbi:hypothetical protein IR152_05170 [Clostridioides sp. ES-S-0108-01]|uniref:hypothetical protein n=1 Tax=Clostridioides sp. ES-S-0108-01 TaxID=2770773 RepID=UPI001D0C1C12|nr:hypothetical protein [Clostridioides sp. ES-S-0108-01]UDN50948.1 hypothetical protein JJC16_16700 [Clostridioides sp. ES-S-0107-01]
MSKYKYSETEQQMNDVLTYHAKELSNISFPDTEKIDASIVQAEAKLKALGIDVSKVSRPKSPASEKKVMLIPTWNQMVAEAQASNTPLLVCGKCAKRYIPMTTNLLIKEVCKMDKEVVEIDKQAMGTIAEPAENKITWFDFEKIKNKFLEQRFISEKVKFLYDKDDYYFIPGLVREWEIGFLTPVFFNIEVLLKYMHHPDYGLDIGADTFGYIYKGDEHYITFGINENNKVIMWLGDIGNMPLEEQFYLRSENVLSDHSIGSEFYEAEIEVVWANPSAENNLIKKRLVFNESIRSHYGLSVAQLDTETVRIVKNIYKLLIDTNDAFKDLMIPMNELLVESINSKEIKKRSKKQISRIKRRTQRKEGY